MPPAKTAAKKRQRPDMRSRKNGEPVSTQTKKRAPVRVKHLKQKLRNDLVPVECDPLMGMQAGMAAMYGIHLQAVAEATAAAADGEYVGLTMKCQRADGTVYTKTNPYAEMVRATAHDLTYAAATAVKVGLDAKVVESQVRLAEGIAAVLEATVADLKLSAAQRKQLPAVMSRHLKLLDPPASP